MARGHSCGLRSLSRSGSRSGSSLLGGLLGLLEGCLLLLLLLLRWVTSILRSHGLLELLLLLIELRLLLIELLAGIAGSLRLQSTTSHWHAGILRLHGAGLAKGRGLSGETSGLRLERLRLAIRRLLLLLAILRLARATAIAA